MEITDESLVESWTLLLPAAPALRVAVAGYSETQWRTLKPDELDQINALTIESALLQFTAPTAVVMVSRSVCGTFLDCEDQASRCHAVIINDSCAGLALLNSADETPRYIELTGRTQKEAWSTLLKVVEECILIALSAIYTPWGLYLPIDADFNSENNLYHIGEEGDDYSHFPFDRSNWDHQEYDTLLVNVMIIEWHDGIASRRGVSQVHAEVWSLTGPLLKPIMLE